MVFLGVSVLLTAKGSAQGHDGRSRVSRKWRGLGKWGTKEDENHQYGSES